MPNNNISQQEKYAILAEEWFENARNALGYAKTGLLDTEFYSWICFLCQQAAELYLKGFLTLNGVEPPRIHDLVKLWERCNAISADFSGLEEACRTLTDYYIETRYPPEVKTYSREQAEEAVKLASEVENLVRKFREEVDLSARSDK